MKQQVVYIHGGEAFSQYEDFLERLRTIPLWHMSDENTSKGKKWNQNLDETLGEEYQVILPPMPNRQNAVFEEWKIWFERHFEYFNNEPVLIGCSLGAMFLAKYLSLYELPFEPRAIILMAGAYDLPDFDGSDCGDFLVKPDQLTGLENKFKKIIIMHSKDDFVVPFEHGEALSHALPQAEFVVFQDKNHFLIEEFPELIAKIKEISVAL